MARLIVIRDGDVDMLTLLRKQLIQQDHKFAPRELLEFAEAIGRVIWAPIVERRCEHDENCGG